MIKKMSLFALALIFASQPAMPVAAQAQADAGGWQAPQIEAAWNYDGYRVERHALASDIVGPVSVGDLVLVADPADSCTGVDCDIYHVTMLKDGMSKHIPNLPGTLLDETRYRLNDDRLVYITNLKNSDTHFTVVELDAEFNESEALVEDVFLTSVTDVDVMVEGIEVYLNPEFNNNTTGGYQQKAVYIYDHKSGLADIIGKHYDLRRENLLDVQDRIALASWEFKSGNEQLWLMNAEDEDNRFYEAVPYTWTEPEGDIVGAHFTKDGSIEYFQYFKRFTFDPKTDERPVEHPETLSWYRDVRDALQITRDRMAWVDAEDTLFVSDGDSVLNFGLVPGGVFTLQSDRIFYATAEGGVVYDFARAEETQLGFGVTDAVQNIVVGTDQAGTVWYQNLDTGKIMNLGFGSSPVVSDAYHVYWRGDDNKVYETTISPSARTNIETVSALKTSDSPRVYLVSGTQKWYIPNEDVYFSYFDSWTDVKNVEQAQVDSLENKGTIKFAPGTLVKLANDPRVYTVGEDGKLHWITSQTVAYAIYGSIWNRDIVEVPMSEMVNYGYGINIYTEADIYSI